MEFRRFSHVVEYIELCILLCWAARHNVELGPEEGERTERLLRIVSDWSAGPQGMLRIVDLTKLLQDLEPLLARRAEGLPAFEIAVGCQWKNETDWTTVRWDGTKLSVKAERSVENAVKLDIQKLTTAVFGGAYSHYSQRQRWGALERLLPVTPTYRFTRWRLTGEIDSNHWLSNISTQERNLRGIYFGSPLQKYLRRKMHVK